MTYKCPRCGNDMFLVTYASDPPVGKYVCMTCLYESLPLYAHDNQDVLPMWLRPVEDEENKYSSETENEISKIKEEQRTNEDPDNSNSKRYSD